MYIIILRKLKIYIDPQQIQRNLKEKDKEQYNSMAR